MTRHHVNNVILKIKYIFFAAILDIFVVEYFVNRFFFFFLFCFQGRKITTSVYFRYTLF